MKSHCRIGRLGLGRSGFSFGRGTSQAKTFDVHVERAAIFFAQALITIEPGDTIEWVWYASFHSTTFRHAGQSFGEVELRRAQ